MKVFIYTKQKHQEKYIEEWCKYNKRLGFDGIIIDNNNDNVNDGLYKSSFIQYIDRVGQKWENVPPDGTPLPHYQSAQVIWANDARKMLLEKYPNEEVWVFNTDIDEFIDFKGNFENIKQYIYYIKERKIWNVFIWWEYYDDNDIIYNKTDNCLNTYTRQSYRNQTIRNFINKGTFAWWEGKSISEIHHNGEWMCPHTTKIDIPYNEYEDIDKVSIRHYYTKSLQAWIGTKALTTNTAQVGRRPNIIKTFFKFNRISLAKLMSVERLLQTYNVTITPEDKDFLNKQINAFKYILYYNTNKQIFVSTINQDSYEDIPTIKSPNLFWTLKYVYNNINIINRQEIGFCYEHDMFQNENDYNNIYINNYFFQSITHPTFLEFITTTDNYTDFRKKLFTTKETKITRGNKFFITRGKFISMMKELIPMVNDFQKFIKKKQYQTNVNEVIENDIIPIFLI